MDTVDIPLLNDLRSQLSLSFQQDDRKGIVISNFNNHVAEHYSMLPSQQILVKIGELLSILVDDGVLGRREGEFFHHHYESLYNENASYDRRHDYSGSDAISLPANIGRLPSYQTPYRPFNDNLSQWNHAMHYPPGFYAPVMGPSPYIPFGPINPPYGANLPSTDPHHDYTLDSQARRSGRHIGNSRNLFHTTSSG